MCICCFSSSKLGSGLGLGPQCHVYLVFLFIEMVFEALLPVPRDSGEVSLLPLEFVVNFLFFVQQSMRPVGTVVLSGTVKFLLHLKTPCDQCIIQGNMQ